MKKLKALLLTGSPAKNKSTSCSIGEYILDRIDEDVYDREIMHLYSIHNSADKMQLLLERTDDVDLLVISTPVYVDTTPAVLMKILQAIHQHRLAHKPVKEQKLLTISNCGFPEVEHNLTHLRVLENFAKQSGFTWIGGIPVRMGGAIHGRSLGKIKGMARNLIKGLDLFISRIDETEPVNDEVLKLVTKKFMPNWLYRSMGNSNWNKLIKKNNTKKHIYDKPYA